MSAIPYSPRRPRRVLLLARQLTSGGSERQLAETAIGLRERGFETHVGCFHGEGARGVELRAAGVPVLTLPVTSFGSPSALREAWNLGRYIRRHGIQLVHAFDQPLSCYATPVARFFRTPKVLSSQRAYRSLTPRYWIGATDWIVDGIVVNCEAMGRHLVEDEGVPAGMIHLCYNSLDTARFFPAPQQRVPALAGAQIVMGSVCVFRPEKDLGTLVEAFATVRSETPGCKLMLVGDGPERASLERQAESLGVRADCVFAGEARDVAAWMRQIDIFVLPTRSEALSNSLMEAMACGCAAVATRIGGNPELIAHERTGLIYEMGQVGELTAHLRRLARDAELRRQMAAAGAADIAARFNRQVSMARIAAIYDSQLDSIR